MRATSRRNKRNLLGCSSWPLCCCKRRCKLSWRKSRLLVSNSSVLNSVISFIFIVRQAATTWCRLRNFVRTGSLSAASLRDSRATDSGTPSSSNKMFPGRTVATQYSGCPLPLPMRVSGGRAVTDLSGKMRIHSLPLRFMLRVRATRAASNCVLVIQARSSVCKPNSPKSILRLREAVPLRLPRWDLRYFTRFGINGIDSSLDLLWDWHWRRWRSRSRRYFGRPLFFLTNPTFHADLAVNCVCLCKTVIDWRAQRVQRNFSLAIPFRARNLGAIETPRASEPNALGAKILRSLHRLFHRAAIGDAALDLQRNVLRDQLRVEFRRLDFLDVDLDLLAFGHLGNFLGHLFDLCALSAANNAGTRSMNGHPN